MTVKKPKIFLSYSWANAKIADVIDSVFESVGINLIRDIRDLKKKGSIKKFMRGIKKTDYVLTLISDEFLKSENVMFEIMELLKRNNYEKHTIQILFDNAPVFDSGYRVNLLNYWKDKQNAFAKDLDNLGVEYIGGEKETLENYTNICNNIGKFLDFLNEENAFKLTELKKKGYQPILALLGYDRNSLLSELIIIGQMQDEVERDIALIKFVSEHPNNPNVYLMQGLLSKSNRKAICFYDLALKKYPEFSVAYNNRGNCRSALDDKKGALEDYSNAIVFNPDYADAYNNRGAVKYTLGDKQGALEDYNKAIEFNPGGAEAYNNRGVCRSALEDKQGALEDYNKAINFNPGGAEAYFNRGVCRSALDDKQGALEDYSNAIVFNLDYADAYNNRSVCRFVLGDKKGALEDCNKAIKLNPDYAGAHSNRSLYKHALGDEKGALEDYNKAIELSPGGAESGKSVIMRTVTKKAR